MREKKWKIAGKILKNGGVVVLPTDTVYGIVGQALNKKTVERIYSLKERDTHKPFIILISSVKDLKTFSAEENQLMKKVWPGPVSIILPVKTKKFLHRGTKSLAFRMPNHKKLKQLLKKTGPLVAPSANPQGEKPAETLKEAQLYFGNNVDLYISAGRRLKGKPSSLIAPSKNGATVVREGRGIKKLTTSI